MHIAALTTPQFRFHPKKEFIVAKRQQGFTLIEIAIVLVIIGLLLGGVLKGQELITSARVRNIISQQDGIKAAYFGFLDRFRGLPGDYSGATANIAGVSAASGCGLPASQGNGDGNGRIDNIAAAPFENVLAWEHLSKAGFINGSFTCAAAESAATTPTNAYAVRLQLIFDNVYLDAAAVPGARHNLKTGSQIPSDLLGEIDRKIDDGVAQGGVFRHSTYDPSGGGTNTAANCVNAGAGNVWQAVTPFANCGGATLF
jgi:prepilin-type N-terminal cleavage/methylation domain-containing protein